MIDKKYLQLMHKQIDGEITQHEFAKLQNYLSLHEEARVIYDELTQTNEVLNQVPALDPPNELSKMIMNSIDPELYTAKQRSRFNYSQILNWFATPNRKPAYAFAVGLVIGLILYAVIMVELFKEQSIDITDVYGTISHIDSNRLETLHATPIETEQLQGSINIKRLDDLIWFEIVLQCETTCDLTLAFDKKDLRFIGYHPSQPAQINFENQENSIKVAASDRVKFNLFFNKLRNAATFCDLKVGISANEIVNQKFDIKK
jgi:hypothetical protein